MTGVTIWGILFWVIIIVIPLLIVARQTQMENRAIRRYAKRLKAKEKKDEKDFIFVDPEETESLRNQSIEEEREEDELTEEAYDFAEDLM